MAAGGTTTLTATVNATSSCSSAVTWSVAPSGGTLSPNGNAATFTAPSTGSYTVTAVSSADATKSGAATVAVTAAAACGTANGTIVTHAANVAASETWAGDGVTHRVPTSISVTGTAVLTVQPCAIVALGAGASITVRDSAKLVAAGTGATRFVAFRRDNAAQPWGILRGYTDTSLIELHWTRLEGGGAFGGQLKDPAVAVFGSGYGSPPAPVLRVDNVTIDSPQGAGVYLDANAALTSDSQQLTISGAGGTAVFSTLMSLGSIPSGSYTGNATDEFVVFGSSTIFADFTIHDRGVPARIQTSSLFVGPSGGATAPVTPTIEPGVMLKSPRMIATQPGARCTFGSNGNSPNNVVGILSAIGTAAKPIVFTSGEATPAPDDWVGLWLNTANGSRLEHVEIAYAGGANGIQSNNCRPLNIEDEAALLVGDFDFQYVPPDDLITSSRIHHSAGFGINAMWQAATVNAPNLTAGNLFENNAGCAQTYNALTPPSACPALRGCTAN